MDKPPEKLPRKISKVSSHSEFPGWEDLTNEGTADSDFMHFLRTTEEQGIRIDKNTKILEIGSGNAAFLNLAKKRGVEIIGVDVKPRGHDNKLQILARAEQLPFPDESFEIITSHGIHDPSVYDQYPDLMMKEIYRVLKPGGIYICFEAGKIPLLSGMRLVKNKGDYILAFKKSE